MTEGLKGIAAHLGELWGGVEISIFQVWRAIRRQRDPLPAKKNLGRWAAEVDDLQGWARRQSEVRRALMLQRSSESQKSQL